MTVAKKRKRVLNRLRGLLLLVFAAYFYYLQYMEPARSLAVVFIFYLLYFASWILFLALPAQMYSRLNLQYIIFLFDMAFILGGIYLMQVAGLSFYVAVFLVVFATAIARSIMLTVLIGLVGSLSYALLVANIPLSPTVFNGSEYLALPFLFLVALLNGYMAAESDGEQKRLEVEKAKVQRAFTKYVSQPVADAAMRGGAVKLGGEKRILTVSIADIRNFTAISEILDPSELALMLDEFFNDMAGIITGCGGTLDKFMGDAVIALFGAPARCPDHAARAVKAGLLMQQHGKALAGKWLAQGRRGLEICVGLNTSEAIVGNIGSRERLEYTAIGDAVNVCTRLEAANRIYGVNIICGEDTYKAVKDRVAARELDLIKTEQKGKTMRIYELVGEQPARATEPGIIKSFHRGLAQYRQQKWAEARNTFDSILRVSPADGPATVFRERCLLLQKAPPGADWDGAYVLEAK